MTFPVAAVALTGSFLTLTAARAQTCPPDFELVSSPNAPGSNALIGVAVIAEDDVWAVGYSYTSTTHFETLTEHWDGARWTIVPSPSPSSISQLFGVSATATDDVWAVGVQLPGGVSPSQVLIEHWDGSEWMVVAGPDLPGSPRLDSVVALTAADAWAVGRADPRHALAIHWDGNEWAFFPSPDETGPRLAVTAVSSTDIWSAGMGAAVSFTHWDGTSWTVVPNPPGQGASTMRGISAVSSTEVWAVGEDQFQYCDPKSCYAFLNPVLQQWDGNAWQSGPRPYMYGLWVGLNDISRNQARISGLRDIRTQNRWCLIGTARGGPTPLSCAWVASRELLSLQPATPGRSAVSEPATNGH